jgi:autotransporter-associated beta strand protein
MNRLSVLTGTRLRDTLYSLLWDANGSTAGQTDGAGAWLNTGRWWTGTTNVTWTPYDAPDVIFGNGGNGGAVTLASPITVNSINTKTFNGTYTLGTGGQTISLINGFNSSTTSGIVNISSPILMLGKQTWTNNSLNTVTVNAQFDNNGSDLTINGRGVVFINGLLTGSGGIVKNGIGRLNLHINNANTYTGTTIINRGSLRQGNNSSSLSPANLVLNNGVLAFYWISGLTRTLGTGNNQIQVYGISGFGGEGKSGPTVNLGSTIIWGALGEGSATGYFNPTIFILGDERTPNAGRIAFSSNIDLNGTTRTISVPPGLNNNYISTITGAISNSVGTAGIIKLGLGTLQLNTVNTYNGPTTISEGVLNILNSITGTGNVYVYGGTLLGRITTGASASIAGPVNLSDNPSSIIRPGSYGNNTLNTGSLTFEGTNSVLYIDTTAATMSKVNVTGNVNLGGCSVVFSGGLSTSNTYKIITCSGTMSGTLPTIISNSTSKTIVLQQNGNDLEAVVT